MPAFVRLMSKGDRKDEVVAKPGIQTPEATDNFFGYQ